MCSTAQVAVAAPIWDRKYFGLQSVGTPCLLCSMVLIVVFSAIEVSLPILTSYLLFGGFGVILACTLDRTSAKMFLIVYACATIAALGMYCIYSARFGIPYFSGGSDDLTYEQDAMLTAKHVDLLDFEIKSHKYNIALHNSPGYVCLLSVFCRLAAPMGGFHTMIPRLFNCAVLALMAVGVYRITLIHSGDERLSVGAGLFTGLMPVMMYNAVHVFRDTIVGGLVVLLLYWFVRADRSHRLSSLLVAVLCSLPIILVLGTLRSQIAVISALFVIVSIACFRARSAAATLLRAMACCLLIVACSYVVVTASNGWINEGLREYHRYLVRYTDLRGTGSGLSAALYRIPLFPLGMPARILHGFVMPIPLPILEIDRIWLSIGGVVQYTMLPFLIAGLAIAFKRSALLPLAVLFVALFLPAALLTGSFRHVSMYYPFGIILASLGYGKYKAQFPFVISLMSLFAAVALSTYVYLKP